MQWRGVTDCSSVDSSSLLARTLSPRPDTSRKGHQSVFSLVIKQKIEKLIEGFLSVSIFMIIDNQYFVKLQNYNHFNNGHHNGQVQWLLARLFIKQFIK